MIRRASPRMEPLASVVSLTRASIIRPGPIDNLLTNSATCSIFVPKLQRRTPLSRPAAVVMPADAGIQIKAAVVCRSGPTRAAAVRGGGLHPSVRGRDTLAFAAMTPWSAPPRPPGAVAPLNAKARGLRKAWREMGFVGLPEPAADAPHVFSLVFPPISCKPLIGLDSGTDFGIVSE
jgi:hypothetical protein